MLKIATWNINSIRLRLDLIKKFCNLYNPDLISFQETKVMDSLFPTDVLKNLGYPYIAYSGQKSYNGVAIISKIPFLHSFSLSFINEDKRHIAVLLKNFELHNFYIPAGGDIPNVEINPKFAHKLQYIEQIKEWFLLNRSKTDKICLVGDLNIAPYENDVWCTKYMKRIVSHTPIERNLLLDLKDNLGMRDSARHFIPMDQKIYTWWSYRSQGLIKNLGLRLDHIWCTHSLLLEKVEFAIEARQWERPSDHIPCLCSIYN